MIHVFINFGHKIPTNKKDSRQSVQNACIVEHCLLVKTRQSAICGMSVICLVLTHKTMLENRSILDLLWAKRLSKKNWN